MFKNFIKQLFYTGLFIIALFLVVRLLRILSYTELLTYFAFLLIAFVGLWIHKNQREKELHKVYSLKNEQYRKLYEKYRKLKEELEKGKI